MAKRQTTTSDRLTDAPSPRLQAAQRLWATGRQNDALSLFSEAVRQEPNNVRAYILAARAYAEKFDFQRMEEIHARLLRRAPRHPGVHHYIGETFGLLKLPGRAIANYERAAALPGAGPPTWMELASLYERAHRLEEAQELIERTVRTGFDHPLVPLVRARIQRRLRQLDDARATLRTAVARGPAESEWVCQAWSELALMHDEAGEYDAAIEAIENCKRMQRLREAPHLNVSDKVHVQMREMFAAISRDDFRRWRDAASELPQQQVALLTGFPRSGTTLLEQVLDAHSDLVSSEERDYIGREMFHTITAPHPQLPLLEALDQVSLEQLPSERQRYLQAMEYLLGEPIGTRMHLDKNPAYNLTIPLVLRLFPETRLIMTLRDPRDVVLSCYLRYLPLNSVSVQFFDIRRTAQRYALDMTAWLECRELIEVPWCEIRYEDAVADLATQARRALATLGLEWNDHVLQYRERLAASKQITSPSYEAVAQPIYTRAVGRWKNYERLLGPAQETLAPFLREFGYN